MATTIQISEDLKQELIKRKTHPRDTYEGVIWDLIEANMELSEETKKDIEEGLKDFKEGRTISHEKLMKELGH